MPEQDSISHCQCGNKLSRTEHSTQKRVYGDVDPLGASFVHLSKPIFNTPASNDAIEYNHGFIATNNYVKTLLSVAEGWKDSNSATNTPFLCGACISRVASALETDTARLRDEMAMYADFVAEEEGRMKQLESIVRMSEQLTEGQTNQSTADFYLKKDINHLNNLCDEHERNLMEMSILLKDQVALSNLLLKQEEELLFSFNNIEMKVDIFNDMNNYLMMKCIQLQKEVSSLNHVQLLTSMFHISIDDRGWRYPLINSLRLSHKPKGDLTWSEISAAWSQASQLAMFLGNAYKFDSPSFIVVPLSGCAKIIEFSKGSKVAYNMGVEVDALNTISSAKGVDNIVHSTLIFYRYLSQLLTHVRQTKQLVSPIPYHPSVVDIEKYNEGDDPSWGALIHYIAATLKWLCTNNIVGL